MMTCIVSLLRMVRRRLRRYLRSKPCQGLAICPDSDSLFPLLPADFRRWKTKTTIARLLEGFEGGSLLHPSRDTMWLVTLADDAEVLTWCNHPMKPPWGREMLSLTLSLGPLSFLIWNSPPPFPFRARRYKDVQPPGTHSPRPHRGPKDRDRVPSLLLTFWWPSRKLLEG